MITNGSFPLSGTVRYSTVRYVIISVSTVRSCEWYQNSEPYRRAVASGVKGGGDYRGPRLKGGPPAISTDWLKPA